MFASLKSRIREETGSDFTKLSAKFDTLRSKRAETSLNSSNLNNSDEAPKIRELTEKLQEKDCELKNKDKKLEQCAQERDKAYEEIAELKLALKNCQDLQQKLTKFHLNTDEIDNFRQQELSRIKQLVLDKDKELLEKSTRLTDAEQELQIVRSELMRLRTQEEKLNDVQDDFEALRHSSARDLASLASNLTKSDQELKYCKDLLLILRKTTKIDENGADLERKLLEQRLEETHIELSNIKITWSDKIVQLETQVTRLSRAAADEGAERRRAQLQHEAVLEQLQLRETELERKNADLEAKNAQIRRYLHDIDELTAANAENEEKCEFLRKELEMVKVESKLQLKNLENSELQCTTRQNDEVGNLKFELNSLEKTVKKLTDDLNVEKTHAVNVQNVLMRVTSEKNAFLLRNAELAQELTAERRKCAEKLREIEEKSVANLDEMAKAQETDRRIHHFDEEIMEKNQTIKMLQLRLADLKKTFHQELKIPTENNNNNNNNNNLKKFNHEEEINFKYLKHVVIKFLTSKEYEAQHLIKAISTLLKFTQEEEKLIQETLEWKKSWFGPFSIVFQLQRENSDRISSKKVSKNSSNSIKKKKKILDKKVKKKKNVRTPIELIISTDYGE